MLLAAFCGLALGYFAGKYRWPSDVYLFALLILGLVLLAD